MSSGKLDKFPTNNFIEKNMKKSLQAESDKEVKGQYNRPKSMMLSSKTQNLSRLSKMALWNSKKILIHILTERELKFKNEFLE